MKVKTRYLLYHAELQRRIIQGIPTENKCLLFPYLPLLLQDTSFFVSVLGYNFIFLFCSLGYCTFINISDLVMDYLHDSSDIHRGHVSRIPATFSGILFSMKGIIDSTFTLDVFSIVSTIISFLTGPFQRVKSLSMIPVTLRP
jgi:SNF family Na+-dependent transporter